jgi:hypothetical protein
VKHIAQPECRVVQATVIRRTLDRSRVRIRLALRERGRRREVERHHVSRSVLARLRRAGIHEDAEAMTLVEGFPRQFVSELRSAIRFD